MAVAESHEGDLEIEAKSGVLDRYILMYLFPV